MTAAISFCTDPTTPTDVCRSSGHRFSNLYLVVSSSYATLNTNIALVRFGLSPASLRNYWELSAGKPEQDTAGNSRTHFNPLNPRVY